MTHELDDSHKNKIQGIDTTPGKFEKRLLLMQLINDMDRRKQRDIFIENPSVQPVNTKHLANSPPAVHPAVEKWFKSMVTAEEGKITAKELQQAFAMFQRKHISDTVCKVIVRLFDLDQAGGLDLNDFEYIYFSIKQWLTAFNAFDRQKSGYLDENELQCALKQMEMNLSSEFIRFLITRNNPKAKKMSLDQYIIACIQIQKFTDEFKRRDTDFTGNVNIKYEEFLRMIMRCI